MSYEQREYKTPSLELFQEMIWDRTEHLDLSDDEVKDLAIWSGHKFLGYSLGDLAKAWCITKDAARAVVRRMERRKDKQQGLEDMKNAALVTAISL